MLRPFKKEDTEAVVAIWLEASIQAHGFIDRAYWEARAQDMRTLYLPLSEIVVDETETGELTGFMALVDAYLAALFVAPQWQGQGIGSRMLRLAKKMHATLELSVYAENGRAVGFYQKQGFGLAEERVEAATGHAELVLVFPSDRQCGVRHSVDRKDVAV